MSKQDKRITVMGPVNLDVLARPVDFGNLSAGSVPMEDIRIGFGGDALNEAVVLRRLGADVGLVTKIGQDGGGDQLAAFLREEGVNLDGLRREADLATSVNIVLVDGRGERFFLTDPRSSMRRQTLGDYLPAVDSAADLVSFAGMFVSPFMDVPALGTLFSEIKKKPGRVLSVDMTKAKRGETLKDLEGILPYVDYILPNEAEVALLTGERDARANARLLTEAGAGCAVIKCGGRGCVACRGGECLSVPAWPVSRVVDTTGAGDTFAAGFLFALLHELPLEDCCAFANAAASCAVESVGANTGVLSREEPLRRFREMTGRSFS